MQQASAIRFAPIRCSRSRTWSSNIAVGGKIVSRGVRRQPAGRPRRDAGPGRRIRLRQVDAGPRGAAVAPADSGRVLFDGNDLTAMQGDALRLMRRRLQLIFQDPIASLNPRRRIGDIVAEPLVIAGVKDPARREQRVCEVLERRRPRPGLVVGRLPHEFSGGQCQRICIARALMLEPEFIICDEPVSALDVSIRAQILNLLEDMKARYGLTLLFIAHDLAVVKAVSDRVAVMYLGRLCEVGPTEQLFASAGASLYGAAARGDPGARSRRPPGRRPCRSASRRRRSRRRPAAAFAPAARADARCSDEVPELRAVAPGQFAACHHPLI